MFIVAREYDFAPAGVLAQAGAHVRLTLSNQGTVPHSWVLKDSLGNTLEKVTAAAGQIAQLDFNAPLAAGAYTFVCDVSDHAQLGMKGQLTVR
jgi:plastocyanin